MGHQTKIPSCVYVGVGSVEETGTILKQESSKKALVFTDEGVVEAGLLDKLTAVLEHIGVEYKVFDGLNPELAYTNVEKVVEQVNREGRGIIIAISGGNIVDAAKLCFLLRGSSCTVTDLLASPLLVPERMKAIMIPTTCGTGSEATCNAIVAIPEEQSKKSIMNAEMIPDCVILDAQMIAGLPASIVAATGVDALIHMVKCFASEKVTPLGDTYATASTRLVFRSTEETYKNPGDMEARSNMMLGAFYGGVAITGNGTTAVHILSYPLGGKHHIPHGVSNAILFTHAMAFNKDAYADRLGVLCDAVYPERAVLRTEEKADYMIGRITAIIRNTEIPVHLNAFGMKMADLDLLVDAGSKQQRPLVNSRRKLSLEDIRTIYLKVLKEE